MTAETGFIVTFYSYKGGVGRTMALANIAVLLAQKGLSTLAVDFDLEAPGLHRYFLDFGVRPDDANEGMLDILVDARDGHKSDWRRRVVDVDLKDRGQLSMLTSGLHDEGYPQRVLDFNWRDFFEHRGGGQHIEELRDEWIAAFDVVLVDSRTGITDSGGVCTIQLPDILVPMFTANDQSVQGCRDVAVAAQQARQQLAFDRPPLLVFPLPSRFDGRAQYEESRTWLTTFANELGTFYDTWLPKSLTPRSVLERTKLPYIAYFSFGEKLPVVTEGTTDPEGLGFALATAAALIGSKFQDVEGALFGGPLPADKVDSSASAEILLAQWERMARRSADAQRRGADRKRRAALLARAAVVLSTVIGGVIVLVVTGVWSIGAIAVLLAVLVSNVKQFRGEVEPTAQHLAAAASWDAVAQDVVDVARVSASGDASREQLDVLRTRIEGLEAETPAVDLGDTANPGRERLLSTAESVVLFLSGRTLFILKLIGIVIASAFVLLIALELLNLLLRTVGGTPIPDINSSSGAGAAWIVLSVAGIALFLWNRRRGK